MLMRECSTLMGQRQEIQPVICAQMLTGNHAVFPVEDRKLVRGSAQEIFFCEYDGAQSRTVYVEVMGE